MERLGPKDMSALLASESVKRLPFNDTFDPPVDGHFGQGCRMKLFCASLEYSSAQIRTK